MDAFNAPSLEIRPAFLEFSSTFSLLSAKFRWIPLVLRFLAAELDGNLFERPINVRFAKQ